MKILKIDSSADYSNLSQPDRVWIRKKFWKLDKRKYTGYYDCNISKKKKCDCASAVQYSSCSKRVSTIHSINICWAITSHKIRNVLLFYHKKSCLCLMFIVIEEVFPLPYWRGISIALFEKSVIYGIKFLLFRVLRLQKGLNPFYNNFGN